LAVRRNIREAALGFQLLENANQATARQRGVDLDRQRIPAEVVEHNEGSEANAVAKRVASFVIPFTTPSAQPPIQLPEPESWLVIDQKLRPAREKPRYEKTSAVC
jgi:hypothetical protein